MKHFLYAFIAISLVFSGQTNFAMNTAAKNKSKLSWLGFFGLQSFVGWSAYNYIKDQYSLKNRKLYAKDFPALGVRYINHSEFDETDKDITHQEIEQSQFYQENSAEHDQLARTLEKDISYGSSAPLYLSYINKKIGYGAFADKALKAGDFIGEYTGKVYNRFDIKDKKSSAYGWALPNMLIVDGYKQSNELRFVNHSAQPNVTTKYIPINDRWRLVYIADKPIAKDEQLLVDYGAGYWTSHGTVDENAMKQFRFRKVKDKMQKWLEKLG